MKKTIFKWMTIVMVAIVSVCFISCDDDDNDNDKNNQEETANVKNVDGVLIVNVKTAGTFESLIGTSKKYLTDKLKVSGPLNGDDIRSIREMMITANGGRLESLNMADASIVEGGEPYKVSFDKARTRGEVPLTTHNNFISESMFEDCDALQELVLPNSVVRISHYMFGYGFGSNIRKITIGRSTVGSIDHKDDDVLGVLAWMDKLEEIKVHAENPKFASVNGIMYNKDKTVLYNVPPKCKQSLAFPNSLKTIAGYAFRGYSASSIKLPSSVERLENRAFMYSEFKTIDIGSVSEIGNTVFFGCDKTESIILSESLTWIPDDTFRSCKLLSTISLPKSIRLIGKYVFHSCDNLNSIYMESSNPPAPTSDVTNTGDVFTFVTYENIKLYVPKGSKSKYSSTIPWNGLKIIEI